MISFIKLFINEFLTNFNLYAFNTFYSFVTMLLGFVLSLIVAFFLGLLTGYIPKFKKFFYPILIIAQSTPLIVVAPWLIMFFGFGIISKVLIVFIFTLPPISINFIDAILRIDKEYLILMKVMRASRKNIFFKVELPYAIKNYLSGAKISASYSFGTVIVAEWIGGYNGLGIVMQRFLRSYKTESIFISSLIIIIVSFSFFKFIEYIEKKLIFW